MSEIIIRDNFDRAATWLTKFHILRWFKPLYVRHKEFLLYGLFGIGTILVSVSTYMLMTEVFGWNILIANAISWIFATTFAFVTNRIWVFTRHPKGIWAFLIQFTGFYFGRVLTLVLEEWILYYFVGVLELPNFPVKLVAQAAVIAGNYVFSKLIVFRKRSSRK